ncbi:helix-turn-helix DNA binding domain protein [Gordonia phage Ecliptus]|uniref:Helix-turn-helix DNA binding protein n=1 Tax=Gordonia phage Apricot TaxID=2250319 RepID=A0A345L195_9CAUD|nr:replication initiation protein [Gordonia phage Apricot]AXH49047.1 helix-turn-helix DNA binding protein [Gordonia phage Apricot]WAB10660.1 helix-turn-helix DNA binding domain protein [Gordonia phage Ecliptus]WNM69795.1 hypothetical protein SEA_CRATER_88 [Gordonia phage Crater]
MPDFRVAETAAFDEKIVEAGNAAVGLWARAGSWAMHNLTDGFIPSRIARQLGTRSNANRLVSVGLWTTVSNGYQFVKWDGYQRSREQVEAERAAARDRMKKIRSGEHKGNVQANKTPSSGERSGEVRDGVFATPIPSHPFPSPSGSDGGEGYVSSDDGANTAPPGNLDPHNPRCPAHASVPADDRGPNCRNCRDHRVWLESEPERRRAEIQEANRSAKAIERDCPLCSEGWLLGDDGLPVEPAQKCSHGRRSA